MLRCSSRLSALSRTFNPLTTPNNRFRPQFLPAMSANMSAVTAKDACPRMSFPGYPPI